MVTSNQVLIFLPPTDITTNLHTFQDHVTNIEPIKFKEIKKLLSRELIDDVIFDYFFIKIFQIGFSKRIDSSFLCHRNFQFWNKCAIWWKIDFPNHWWQQTVLQCWHQGIFQFTVLSTLIGKSWKTHPEIFLEFHFPGRHTVGLTQAVLL